MDFILMFRTLHEKGISAEKIDLFAKAYKEWIATGARPLVYDYGLVYYTDGMLCSMPFEVRNLKPVGIEINGVFYVKKCLKIQFNRDFPNWDAGFLFADCPQTIATEIPQTLRQLKWDIFTNPDSPKEPEFALELPTDKEMLALTEVINNEKEHHYQNFFFNSKNYWLSTPQNGKITPFFVMSPYLPSPNHAPFCEKVKDVDSDYSALILPVVHQSSHTFIGHLNEFEVPDEPTLEMYKRLTAHI